MGDHEEFGEHLKRDWFGQRAGQIHQELITDLNRYMNELAPDRRRAILAAAGYEEDTNDVERLRQRTPSRRARESSPRWRSTSLVKR
jgi:hypothetical protein